MKALDILILLQTDDNFAFHKELHFHLNIILLCEILTCATKQYYKNVFYIRIAKSFINLKLETFVGNNNISISIITIIHHEIK